MLTQELQNESEEGLHRNCSEASCNVTFTEIEMYNLNNTSSPESNDFDKRKSWSFFKLVRATIADAILNEIPSIETIY